MRNWGKLSDETIDKNFKFDENLINTCMKVNIKITALSVVRKCLDINKMRVLPRHFLILSLSTVHKFGCFAIALQIIELTTCTKKLEDKSAITMSCLLMSNLQ